MKFTVVFITTTSNTSFCQKFTWKRTDFACDIFKSWLWLSSGPLIVVISTVAADCGCFPVSRRILSCMDNCCTVWNSCSFYLQELHIDPMMQSHCHLGDRAACQESHGWIHLEGISWKDRHSFCNTWSCHEVRPLTNRQAGHHNTTVDDNRTPDNDSLTYHPYRCRTTRYRFWTYDW